MSAIVLGAAEGRREGAGHALRRPDDETDAARDLAGEDARPEVGGIGGRGHDRRTGDQPGRKQCPAYRLKQVHMHDGLPCFTPPGSRRGSIRDIVARDSAKEKR
jgi:hypothetical protein